MIGMQKRSAAAARERNCFVDSPDFPSWRGGGGRGTLQVLAEERKPNNLSP